MTFSIVAFDPATGELGVAAQSKFLAVGAVVPWAEAGVGAVATQAYANTSYGPAALALLKKKMNPVDVVAKLTSADPDRELRQIGVVDTRGRSAGHTGANCYPFAGQVCAKNFCAQGNLLANDDVIRCMVDAYERSTSSLPLKLIATLRAGQRAGGDKRGQQSACLLVVKPNGGYGGFNDRYVDLRVDEHPEPIEELARLYKLHQLFFTRPAKKDLIRVHGPVAATVERCLKKLGFDGDLPRALNDFYHNENFEERMIRPMYIDREVFEYLKTKAQSH
jgi:uncharacterized Ntn-hydrolase superfamily protein